MHREISEREIRSTVLERLEKSNSRDLVIEELGLCHGESRIDIACIGKQLIGFEIKSDFDSLKRLQSQSVFYNSIFNSMYLVTTEKHFANAKKVVPKSWGIFLIKKGPEGLRLVKQRKSLKNTKVKSEKLVRLLWKEEAIQLAQDLPSKRSYKNMTKDELYQIIVDAFNLKFIQKEIGRILRGRENWRPVRRQV